MTQEYDHNNYLDPVSHLHPQTYEILRYGPYGGLDRHCRRYFSFLTFIQTLHVPDVV